MTRAPRRRARARTRADHDTAARRLRPRDTERRNATDHRHSLHSTWLPTCTYAADAAWCPDLARPPTSTKLGEEQTLYGRGGARRPAMGPLIVHLSTHHTLPPHGHHEPPAPRPDAAWSHHPARPPPYTQTRRRSRRLHRLNRRGARYLSMGPHPSCVYAPPQPSPLSVCIGRLDASRPHGRHHSRHTIGRHRSPPNTHR